MHQQNGGVHYRAPVTGAADSMASHAPWVGTPVEHLNFSELPKDFQMFLTETKLTSHELTPFAEWVALNADNRRGYSME